MICTDKPRFVWPVTSSCCVKLSTFMQYGWSLDQATWNLLPARLMASDRWLSVRFSMADANSVPLVPGVYALCSSPPGRRRSNSSSPHNLFSILYTALYIGRTESLRNRFQQHCQHPSTEVRRIRETFGNGVDFWYCRLLDQEVFMAEACLIDCFGPPANRIRGTISARIQRPLPADSGWN